MDAQPSWVKSYVKKNPVKPQVTIMNGARPIQRNIPDSQFGMKPAYTGLGEDGKLQPNNPVDMAQTDRGVRMIHEGEIKYTTKDGKLVVIPASRVSQSMLKEIESEGNIPGYQLGVNQTESERPTEAGRNVAGHLLKDVFGNETNPTIPIISKVNQGATGTDYLTKTGVTTGTTNIPAAAPINQGATGTDYLTKTAASTGTTNLPTMNYNTTGVNRTAGEIKTPAAVPIVPQITNQFDQSRQQALNASKAIMNFDSPVFKRIANSAFSNLAPQLQNNLTLMSMQLAADPTMTAGGRVAAMAKALSANGIAEAGLAGTIAQKAMDMSTQAINDVYNMSTGMSGDLYNRQTGERDYTYKVGQDALAQSNTDRTFNYGVTRDARGDFVTDRTFNYTSNVNAANAALAVGDPAGWAAAWARNGVTVDPTKMQNAETATEVTTVIDGLVTNYNTNEVLKKWDDPANIALLKRYAKANGITYTDTWAKEFFDSLAVGQSPAGQITSSWTDADYTNLFPDYADDQTTTINEIDAFSYGTLKGVPAMKAKVKSFLLTGGAKQNSDGSWSFDSDAWLSDGDKGSGFNETAFTAEKAAERVSGQKTGANYTAAFAAINDTTKKHGDIIGTTGTGDSKVTYYKVIGADGKVSVSTTKPEPLAVPDANEMIIDANHTPESYLPPAKTGFSGLSFNKLRTVILTKLPTAAVGDNLGTLDGKTYYKTEKGMTTTAPTSKAAPITAEDRARINAFAVGIDNSWGQDANTIISSGRASNPTLYDNLLDARIEDVKSGRHKVTANNPEYTELVKDGTVLPADGTGVTGINHGSWSNYEVTFKNKPEKGSTIVINGKVYIVTSDVNYGFKNGGWGEHDIDFQQVTVYDPIDGKTKTLAASSDSGVTIDGGAPPALGGAA